MTVTLLTGCDSYPGLFRRRDHQGLRPASASSGASQQRLLTWVGCLLGSLGRRLLQLLVVQSRRHLGGVPLVVQLKQPIEQFVLGLRADREPHPLRRLPVVMVEREVAPPVGVTHGMIELNV